MHPCVFGPSSAPDPIGELFGSLQLYLRGPLARKVRGGRWEGKGREKGKV